MQNFLDWLAASPLGSAAKAFVALVIASAVADWVTGGAISLAHWQTWVISALSACVVPVVNALNPADPRYGAGSGTGLGEPHDVFNDNAGE